MASCEHCGARVEHSSCQLGGVFFCDEHWLLYIPSENEVAAGLTQAALELGDGFSMVPGAELHRRAIAGVYLPTPTIKWDCETYTYKGETTLRIYVELKHGIYMEDNTHPHVDCGHLCEGAWWGEIHDAIVQSRWKDVLLLAHMATCHYYPDGAYDPIEAIECHFCGSYATNICDACGHDICDDHQRWLGHEDCSGCPDCTTWCDECDTYVDNSDASTCSGCNKNICLHCSYTCGKCRATLCGECAHVCEGCGGTFCESCLSSCAECGGPYCNECLTQCSTCEAMLCSDCMSDEQCSECISKGVNIEEEEA